MQVIYYVDLIVGQMLLEGLDYVFDLYVLVCIIFVVKVEIDEGGFICWGIIGFLLYELCWLFS